MSINTWTTVNTWSSGGNNRMSVNTWTTVNTWSSGEFKLHWISLYSGVI